MPETTNPFLDNKIYLQIEHRHLAKPESSTQNEVAMDQRYRLKSGPSFRSLTPAGEWKEFELVSLSRWMAQVVRRRQV